MTILPVFTTKKQPLGVILPSGEPDFQAHPWPGIVRVIFYSYLHDLPSLREYALNHIEHLAEGGSHE